MKNATKKAAAKKRKRLRRKRSNSTASRSGAYNINDTGLGDEALFFAPAKTLFHAKTQRRKV